MTYAVSYALQQAVYAVLSNDAGVTALVGTDVFDAPPAGVVPTTYVLLGSEVVRDQSSKTSDAALLDFEINVVSDAAGFSAAKQVAVAVCDALVDLDVPLSRGDLIWLLFRSARALRKGAPGLRQIDLKFRAYVEDN
jgi:hypothetical protein